MPNCILWWRRHHSTRAGLWLQHLYYSSGWWSLMTQPELVSTIFLVWLSTVLSLGETPYGVPCHAKEGPCKPRTTWEWSCCVQINPQTYFPCCCCPLSNKVGSKWNKKRREILYGCVLSLDVCTLHFCVPPKELLYPAKEIPRFLLRLKS